MRKSRFILMLAVMVLGALCMSPGFGNAVGPPPKDALYITATASTGGSSPTQDNPPSKYIYGYPEACNGPFSDTLKVYFRIENKDGSTSQENYTIRLRENPGEDNLVASIGGTEIPDTSPPTYYTFPVPDDNTAHLVEILVQSTDGTSTGTPLPPGDYLLTIAIDWTANDLSSGTSPAIQSIQVSIHVNECDASVPSCFLTSSGGVFLENCDAEPISEHTGGTFLLNNKKNGFIVATNPGQFYYNYLWTNDGPAVDVEVITGNLVNLVPHGANALHAYTFDTSGFTQNLTNFDMVNHDGTPCGPYGPCTINVGVGETLWVTWHLEYEKVGQVVSTGTSCPGSEPIGAAIRLIEADSGSEVAGECPADATGYNMR